MCLVVIEFPLAPLPCLAKYIAISLADSHLDNFILLLKQVHPFQSSLL